MKTVVFLGLMSISEAIFISGGVDSIAYYNKHLVVAMIYTMVFFAVVITDISDFIKSFNKEE